MKIQMDVLVYYECMDVHCTLNRIINGAEVIHSPV